MEIKNITKEPTYIKEFAYLCSLEWGTKKNDEEMKKYITNKSKEILNSGKYISILGLIDNDILIGFISLLKEDDNECIELTPWYATMYVKKEYRKHGYSKLLDKSIKEEAKRLGYTKVYLKSNLINYYEKFGAKYIKKLNNGENLFYIDL